MSETHKFRLGNMKWQRLPRKPVSIVLVFIRALGTHTKHASE